MMDFSPLPWGEGGESSEPGEGFLPTEPRNFGIRVNSTSLNFRWELSNTSSLPPCRQHSLAAHRSKTSASFG